MSFWPRLARAILAHPWPILGVILLLTIFFGYWALQVETDHTAGNFVSEESSVIRDFRRASEVFGQSQATLYVVFDEVDYSDTAFLADLHELTRRIGTYEGVENVLSLANVPTLERRGAALEIAPVYDPGLSADENRERIASQPFLEGMLVSSDDAATVMLVSIDPVFNGTPARVDLVERIEEDVRALPARSALAGFPYLRTHYANRVSTEAPLFTVLALLMSLGMLFLAFRSVRAVLLPAIVVVLGLVWTIGLVALFGHKLNIVIAVMPALLVIIGMATAIHITTRFFDKYELLRDRHGALLETIRTVGLATFLACLTTAIGFFVLNFSGSALLSVFGTFASIGIMLLFALSITLIPIAFHRLRPPSEKVASLVTHDVFTRLFDRLAVFTERRSWPILGAATLLLLAGLFGATRISSDIFVFSDFAENDPLRADLAIFESAFGGVLPLEVVIESEQEGAFRNPAVLRRVERLQEELASLEPIGRAMSAADLLKLTNQAYFGGHPANFRLPSNYEMPFLESALNDLLSGENSALVSRLPQMVDSTFSMARVYLGVDDIGTDAMNVLVDSIAVIAERTMSDDRLNIFVTGTAITSTRSGETLVSNLVGSLAMALLVISVLMAILFKNIRLTFISLVPNIIPLMVVGGAMGYFGIALKPSTALIFSLAFGIAVDDTIHFLAKYRILQAEGIVRAAAIRITLSETGKAILFTSLVLMAGFLIFTLSSFGGTANMGALTALTLGVAMLCNLTVLPALLYRFAPQQTIVRQSEETAEIVEAS